MLPEPSKITPPVPNKTNWLSLTWEDLEVWATARSVERGRKYQRQGQVRQLAQTPEGVLLAWVMGTEKYTTRVEWAGNSGGDCKLVSSCTCPVGSDGCKHAVAVVVDYLEAIKKKTSVPIAARTDPRWTVLRRAEADMDAEDSDEEETEDGDFDGFRRSPRPRKSRKKTAGKKKDWQPYLEGLPQAELVRWLMQLAAAYPDVAGDLNSRISMAEGNTQKLVQELRREITQLTSEDSWHDRWSGESHLPDFTGLHRRLELALEQGYAIAVTELGQTLFAAGLRRIESAHDEGDTSISIGACLGVVFRALLQSGLPDRNKLLYVIDMLLDDDYDLCQGVEEVLDRDWPLDVWSSVADELSQRLNAAAPPSPDDFSSSYQRNNLSGWVIHALEKSNRDKEVLPLMEAEAPFSNSYERLVAALIAWKELERAKKWAAEGIRKTEARWPGIADKLRKNLQEIARQEGDWTTQAVLKADEFFLRPSVSSLDELQQAAEKAGCGAAVRAAALRFLETGKLPQPAAPGAEALAQPGNRGKTKKKTQDAGSADPPWPLPLPFTTSSSAKSPALPMREGPHWDVLLALAIQERRPNDIVHWYDQIVENRKRDPHGFRAYYADYSHVADALADSYPDRSVGIYKSIIERNVAETNVSAYEASVPYLRKLRDLYQKMNRGGEWAAYLAELRTKHARKSRFMEVLDRIELKKIIEG